MSLLKEFKIKNDEISEGLMWGGITLPSIMQQKDRSCFSVIKYDPYEKNCRTKNLNLPEFRRGRAIWNEHQHTLNGDNYFLIIFWNPFEIKENPYIENALAVVDKLIGIFTALRIPAHFLNKDEMLTYLHSCISDNPRPLKMPQHNLLLDSYLYDTDFYGGLEPRLGKKHIRIITPTGYL